MKGMTTWAFYNILKQLQDQNLFVVGLINEEQQLLDRQTERSQTKFHQIDQKIEKAKKNCKELDD